MFLALAPPLNAGDARPVTRETNLRVVIIGAGAVGLGLGSALCSAGARVGFVGRPNTTAALRRNGLQRSGFFGPAEASPESFDAEESLEALPQRPADYALVTAKSFDSAEIARSLAACPALIASETQIVLCQNGWGNAAHFAALFPEQRIWNARVITGFRRPEPHRVEITVHAEPVRVGSLFGAAASRVAPFCATIAAGGIPCEPTDTIERDLWAKLLYNGCLNPLGALFGVPYGALAESWNTRAIMDRLAGEVFQVMDAAGYRSHWPDSKSWLRDFYERLLPPTAQHESSMLQDLRAGRRTEIDALTGAVLRLADAHGIDAPVHRTLFQMVRFAEERSFAPASPAAHQIPGIKR